MAVYGKFRERWDPTKRKAKVSKNNTLELKIPTVPLNESLSQRLLFSMRPETLSSTTLGGTHALFSGPTTGNLPLTVRADSLAPELVTIDESKHKPKAIRFPKDGTTGNRCYIESSNSELTLTADMLAGRSRDHDTFISFWVKVDQLNFGGSSGHNIGGFYRSSSGSQSNNDVTDPILDALRPAILFNITTNGTVSIRFRKNDTVDSKRLHYESNFAGKKITAGKWCHVTFVIKRIGAVSNGSADYQEMVDIYIDGVNTGTPTDNVDSAFVDYFDGDNLEFIIGNQEFGYEANILTNLADDDTADGFEGAIGEFIIFTQPATGHPSAAGGVENADGKNRRETAKFIYEAQKEGVFALHSGIHSSSPRLEQIDLDNDTAYPPNFTMPVFTKFNGADKDAFYASDRDQRVSLRSESLFKEGALTDPLQSFSTFDSNGHGVDPGEVETWQERAGQYHVRSIINRDLEDATIIPHLRLNPTDSLLTNGNWYSDARSEFFPEDLDVKNGFVISNLNQGISATSNITSTGTTISVSSTAGMEVGQKLTKVSGTGAFNASGVTIIAVNNATTLTVSGEHSATGPITFHVGGPNITQQLTGYDPVVSDELYREHSVDTKMKPFIDDQIPSEYDDCFVIEIPLPHIGGALKLSTEAEDTAGTAEVAEMRINTNIATGGASATINVVDGVITSITAGSAGSGYVGPPPISVPGGNGDAHVRAVLGTGGNADQVVSYVIESPGTGYTTGTALVFRKGVNGSNVDPGQKIHTMAYYNFKDSKWEYTLDTGGFSTYAPDGFVSNVNWMGTSDIGFSPMTGLVLPANGKNLPFFANLYGRPMTDMGFPVHRKFESKEGQTIDLSKYIDEPVILEGWEIYCDTIPRVGYSHNPSNGNPVLTDDGDTTYHGGIETGSTTSNGKTSQYYGANGHACVLWDPEIDEIIPFYQKKLTQAVGNDRFYNNTVPVSNFTTTQQTELDGSITTTTVELKPQSEAKGLVTKGVTAFLLKETETFNETNQRQKWYSNDSRQVAYAANDINSAKNLNNYDYDRDAYGYTQGQYLGALTDAIVNSNEPTSTTGVRIPPLSYDFYSPKTTTSSPAGRYAAGSSRELIGYLQHIFHNDPNGNLERSFWQRESVTSVSPFTKTDFGINPNWPGTTSIIGLLGKENETYVSGLLRTNTTPYPLHVSGSVKITTPYPGSFPIGNFKISGKIDGGGSKLGIYSHNISPNDIAHFHASSVFPSSEGSTYSEFVQYDSIPNVQGRLPVKTLSVPGVLYPAEEPQNGSGWNAGILFDVDMSLPQNEESDVILNPNDKLVLGIQDSVSTTLASQQIRHNATGQEFIRWGRNYLELPNSEDGYLRLFVKRTRKDDKYNVISDSSRYNQNVNRDLGDHLIDDDFALHQSAIYSGSIADDVIGPTYFGAPTIRQKVTSVNPDTKIFDFGSSAGFYAAVFAGMHGADGISKTFYQQWDLFFSLYEFSATNPPGGGRDAFPDQANEFKPLVADFTANWSACNSSILPTKLQTTPGNNIYSVSVPTSVPLENDKPALHVLGRSLMRSLQAVLVHPDNLFLKQRSSNSYNDPQKWWPAIPNGDFYRGFAVTDTSNHVSGHGTIADFEDATVHTIGKGVHSEDCRRHGDGLIGLLEEIDDRDTTRWNTGVHTDSFGDQNRISWTTNEGVSKTFKMYHHVNVLGGASSWSQIIPFPVIELDEATLEPNVSVQNVIFRHVRIGTYATTDDALQTGAVGQPSAWFESDKTLEGQGYGKPAIGKYPVYPGTTTEMALGDAFYIDSNGDAVKLMTLAESKAAIAVNQNQKWARRWQTSKSSQPGQTIYIVAGRHNIRHLSNSTQAILAPLPLESEVYTYAQLYAKIADVLGAAAYNDDGILFTAALANTVNNNFLEINYPDDPVIRAALQSNENVINSEATFSLLGLTVADKDGVANRNSFFGSPKSIYFRKLAADNSSWWTGMGSLASGADPNYWNSTLNNNATTSLTIATSGPTFMSGYIKKYRTTGNQSYPVTYPDHTNFPASYSAALDNASYNSPSGVSSLLGGEFKVDFTGLPETTPTVELVTETFSPIGNIIDRKVTSRVTDGTAKTFGALTRFHKLFDTNQIFDSKTPKIDLFRSSSINLETEGWEQGWLLDGNSEKMEVEKITDFTLGVFQDPSPSVGSFKTTFTQDGLPIVGSSNFLYGSSTVWVPQGTNISNSALWPTSLASGKFTVKNYFDTEFDGLKSFASKTARDLVLGFSNGVAGRHTVQPALYKYKAFQKQKVFNGTLTSGGSTKEIDMVSTTGLSVGDVLVKINGTGVLNAGGAVITGKTATKVTVNNAHVTLGAMQFRTTPAEVDVSTSFDIVQDLTYSPPRGARFGLYSTEASFSSYVFSYKHYGFLRDMLEQGIDTKFSNHAINELVYGAPVVVNPINPVNPEVPKIMATTSRYNKTIDATIVKPYIENGYENIVQPNNLQSERLRVDVAGSISTKSITAPNNIAANIRTRS